MNHTGKNLDLGTRLIGALIALAVLVTMNMTTLPANAADIRYPKCSAAYDSLVDALQSVGVDASFSNRKAIALLNGVNNYTGSAAQNIQLLNLLKSGSLLRSVSSTTAPLDTNLTKVQFIAQDAKTCKATAVAMAVNLLRGNHTCTTTSMGGSYCNSINGMAFTGSDGLSYTGVYKTDSYVGSAAELSNAVAAALSAGVPVVAAVHSITSGGTRHHWVVIVGKSGDDYLVVDPAYGTAGSISENVRTLSSRNYAFGLTDYATPHYGYVTFVAT